jgi:hypothetical protein
MGKTAHDEPPAPFLFWCFAAMLALALAAGCGRSTVR